MPTLPTAVPAIISSSSASNTSNKKERVVGFEKDVVEGISRRMNHAEIWAACHFEMHARKCGYCHKLYEVDLNHEQLCDVGHRLAQEVSRYLYNRSDGGTYSIVEEDGRLVPIEVPPEYQEVANLLKTVERRSRRRFNDMDTSYYVAPRRTTSHDQNRSIAIEPNDEHTKRSRPGSGEMIDWPEESSRSGGARRIGLYEAALARQRRNAREHVVGVQEPRQHDVSAYCSSHYESRITDSEELRSSQEGPDLGWTKDTEKHKSKPQRADNWKARKWSIWPMDPITPTKLSIVSLSGNKSSVERTHYTKDSEYSDVKSVFSEASRASSATGFSVRSRFSLGQITSATRELLSTFRDCAILEAYMNAIYSIVGPRGFSTEFRRQLKIYSRSLEDEAEDDLSHFAAQLVSLRASNIVEAILESYQTGLAPAPSSETADMQTQDDDDSCSGDAEQLPGLGTSAFKEELAHIKAFWINSKAFKELQGNLALFVSQLKISETMATREGDHTEPTLTSERPTSAINSQPSMSEGLQPAQLPRKSSTTSLPHTLPTEPSHTDTEDPNFVFRAAEDIIFRAVKHSLRVDDTFVRLQRIVSSRGMTQEYVEVLASFCASLGWRGKDAHDVTRASSAQRSMICSRSAARIADYVKAHCEHVPCANSGLATAIGASTPKSASNKPAVKLDSVILVQLLKNGHILEVTFDSKSRNQLKLDIALSLLPADFHEILLSCTEGSLRVASTNDSSWVNRMKAYVEDYSGQEWDWWPLTPRIPKLQSGQSRLEWMFGGTSLFRCVSKPDAEMMDTIATLTAQHLKHARQDRAKTYYASWIETTKRTLQSASRWRLVLLVLSLTQLIRQNVAFLLQRLTQSSNTSGQFKGFASLATTRSSSRSTSTGGRSWSAKLSLTGALSGAGIAASQLPTHKKTPSQQVQSQTSTLSSHQSTTASHRVLFAVQGSRWSLDLEQIPVTSLLNDPAFFRELKTRYKKHRSLIRRLVSPFRFRYCRFVKFEKFDIERIISQGDDLPEYPGFEDDYEYAPRPGRIPMITPKTFAVCLNACDPKCRWPLFNPWHDCVRLPCQSYRLRSIPKKKSDFDVHSDDVGLVAWGLEANYAISFAYVAMYHLVPLLGAFGFWIYWLVRHPGDWQNAAVPVLTVLALFAVIWIPFGRLVSTV